MENQSPAHEEAAAEETRTESTIIIDHINEAVGIPSTSTVVIPDEEGDGEEEVTEPTEQGPPSPVERGVRSIALSVDELHDEVPDLPTAPESRATSNIRLKSTALERYSSLDASNLESLLSGGLDRFYGKYKNAWKKNNLSFPTPEITFEDLSFSVRISTGPSATKGSIGGFLRTVVKPWQKLKTIKKPILHPMTGTIRPGTITLLLANPGAGKSTLLKALAGKIKNKPGRTLKGSITFCGLPADEIQIPKLVGLVDQLDNHLPTLTVRETIQFADRCLNGPPDQQPEKLREVARLRTDLCLHILGLTKCADTVVGDALLRGVSGGERKRVTIGEMIVGGQSVFFCDEISTGLDSAATFDIVKALKSWTRTLGGSAVVALLQPPPEVVELFDDILMLTEGRLVYHGPNTEMLPYFRNLGFECPERIDPAEFAIDVVSGRGARYLIPRASIISKPPRRAQHFEEAFQRSEIFQRTKRTIEEQKKSQVVTQNQAALQSVQHLIMKRNADSRSDFGTGFIDSTLFLIKRQSKFWLRDRPLVYGKLIESVLVGLILGIIYYKVDPKLYLRMLFFASAIFQRQAWQQLTIVFQVRNIFYKQRSRNFFRTLSYTVAEAIVQMPLNIAVSFILTLIFYFMSGLSPSSATFFKCYAIILSFQFAITAYYSMLACAAPSVTVAQAFASLSASFFLLFSGNIILPNLIPSYWEWMHWFNPLAWSLRSLLLNEFHDESYSDAQREFYLARFQITKGPEFIWIGILVLLSYFVIFTLLTTAALHFIRYETQSTANSSPGTMKDTYSEHHIIDSTASVAPIVTPMDSGVSTPSPSVKNYSPADAIEVFPDGESDNEKGDPPAKFVSAYLAVQNLEYFVPNPGGPGELQLLHGITASFEPGKITALMGSSGAGKTTFMDVLAGRKTGGRINGQILVNGEEKDPSTFSRIAGYCEQMDIHTGGATIQEALEFSARLRLPKTTSLEERRAIVKSTMDLLELNILATELVRNCSVEQKKRITIGVEVVANPSILFLDEPTSGLDARSASIVMRGVRSIARTGRTVLCTIHQPSSQIFELFDSLLLLQKGGYTAYFGELGAGAEHLLAYFASIPGTAPMPPMYNPATYMLEVIGAGIGRGQARDYSQEYAKSALCAKNAAFTAVIAQGTIPQPAEADHDSTYATKFSSLHLEPIATSFYIQLRACAAKMRLTYWRNPQYNLTRIVTFPIYAVIFGTTFYHLDEAALASVNSHVGLMYNTLDFIGVINLMTVLDTISNERAVFYRERMSNYYGPLPYAISLFLAELPYLLFVSFTFVNVEYWLVGWDSYASGFFLFWFVFFLHISICTSVGQFMCVLMPNIKVANVAVGALSVFFNLYSGFLMPHTEMRSFYSWIRYLVPTNYSLESIVSIEMGQCADPSSNSHGCRMVKVPGSVVGAAPTMMPLKDVIARFYGFEYESLWTNIGVLLGMWGLLQVCTYLTLRFVSHLKR